MPEPITATTRKAVPMNSARAHRPIDPDISASFELAAAGRTAVLWTAGLWVHMILPPIDGGRYIDGRIDGCQYVPDEADRTDRGMLRLRPRSSPVGGRGGESGRNPSDPGGSCTAPAGE